MGSIPLPVYRPIDGSNADQTKTQYNIPGSPETRIAPANYAADTTNGLVRGPNPRDISNIVSSGPNSENHDPTGLSAFMYVWGQFIDHDIDHTSPSDQPIDITIPKNDQDLTPGGTIPLNRFIADANTHTAINDITGWLDASQVYGSDSKTNSTLRLPDGHMATSADSNLPIIDGAFIGGDVRTAENPDLSAIDTLFVREHNYWVDQLRQQHPHWSGEQLNQQARAIVTAEIQNITYTEFLPKLLGQDAMPAYAGYDPNADPRISQEFTAAAFRFGHSIVSGTETKMDNQGNKLQTQNLADAFLDTPDQVAQNGGVDALLRGIASDETQANDVYAVDELRNLLAAPPDSMDLIAIDIQRERDLGLGTLNQTRHALGLESYTDFNQITSDPTVAANLQKAFGSVDKVDLFEGGLAEDHVDGAMVGPTFKAILTKQFAELRDGDSYWWQNQGFDPQTYQQIQNGTLAEIIERNTNTNVVQQDVFQAADRHSSDGMPADPNAAQLVIGVNDDGATITGGPADDTIVAGLGQNQTLTGAGGKDTFVFTTGNQTATVNDFTPSDLIEFKMSADDFKLTADSSDGHAVITYDGSTINLSGITPDQLTADNFILPHDQHPIV
jgi:peroxidase